MSVDETLMCSFQVNILLLLLLLLASWPPSIITFSADPEAEREEGKISIPGSQQAPDPARSPGRSSGWHEKKMSGVMTAGQLATQS